MVLEERGGGGLSRFGGSVIERGLLEICCVHDTNRMIRLVSYD